MASAAVSSFLLPYPATLCPPPLQLQKKARRTTVRRRILRKSTVSRNQHIHGPLDDIIAEIKSDIRESPFCEPVCPISLDWVRPLKTPSTWAVTPLPVSRAPSDQPLTIRKNRNSRSSTSGSSMGDTMSFSRNNSQVETTSGRAVDTPLPPGNTPWPLFHATEPHECGTATPSEATLRAENTTTRQIIGKSVKRKEGQPAPNTQRRPSRLRLFTSGFPRLRRTRTSETSASTDDASVTTSPKTAWSVVGAKAVKGFEDADDPKEQAEEIFVEEKPHDCHRLRTTMNHMTKQHSTPAEDGYELSEDRATTTGTMPTTLRAAARLFPEVKVLTKDSYEFNVAIEVEGVLYNHSTLANGTIDVIFVVDNGYYVTTECLEKATEAVNEALYHLRRGDRLALYTTHCAHNDVTGNKPELHCPLRPLSTDTEDVVRDLTASIRQCGTQTWEPPRPNPSMADVVLAVAKSLEPDGLRPGRTHIVLLSPAACVLHEVSKTFSDLSFHRVNPAALPYRREPKLQDTVCFESCCTNVFVSNCSSYQSVPGRIKRILKNARSEDPVGALTNVSIDVRLRNGCELIECFGRKEVPHLRLGQVHTLFVRIRVDRKKTQTVDLESINPVFNSSLDAKGLRRELQNAVALGAVKVHIFDVQMYYHNSIHTVNCWNYTEAPFIMVRELGGLAPPPDSALEVLKRQYFHKFAQLTTNEAKREADNLLAILDVDDDVARQVVGYLSREIKCQEAIRKYEHEYRQRLPLCPRPIEIESPHEWLVDLWHRRKGKRNGVANVREGSGGLVDGFNHLERLA